MSNIFRACSTLVSATIAFISTVVWVLGALASYTWPLIFEQQEEVKLQSNALLTRVANNAARTCMRSLCTGAPLAYLALSTSMTLLKSMDCYFLFSSTVTVATYSLLSLRIAYSLAAMILSSVPLFSFLRLYVACIRWAFTIGTSSRRTFYQRIRALGFSLLTSVLPRSISRVVRLDVGVASI